jgi:hypothetical protein
VPAQPPARPSPVLRDPPPPLEANDQLVTAVITAGWAVALVVLLIVRSYIPPGQRWWIWSALAGLVMGLFGLWYVPYLKRARARSAQRRASRRGSSTRPDALAVVEGLEDGFVHRDAGLVHEVVAELVDDRRHHRLRAVTPVGL